MIEDLELNDWQITSTMANQERRTMSIESYYLNRWYSKVEEYTFPTVIYEIQTTLDIACPVELPFKRCMARYENKSPKDSEYWGPITTKEELLKIFYTSLRCKTNQGKYLCIRKWQDNLCIGKWQDNIGKEYRCFWNTRLVAVGVESFEEGEIDVTTCHSIIDYVQSINIPYERCIMDICYIDNKFMLIEFNSWETNSGAYPFSWNEDTEILYPDFSLGSYDIEFRHGQNARKINMKIDNPLTYQKVDVNKLDKIIRPYKVCNYVVTDKYLYVSTDIWLGRFTHDLKNINWKRGEYRFCNIELCQKDVLKVGEEYLYYDLSKCNIAMDIVDNYDNFYDIQDEPGMNRYGFYGIYDEKVEFCRLDNNGEFYIV